MKIRSLMKVTMLVLGAVAFALMLPSISAYAGSCTSGQTCLIELTHANVTELNNNIDIRVTIDDTGATTVLRVQWISGGPDTPLGIDKFAYRDGTAVVTKVDGVPLASSAWSQDNNPPVNYDGFGSFTQGYSDPAGASGISSPIAFTLNQLVTSFPDNNKSSEFAVHIRYSDCSGFVSDGTASTSSDSDCASTKVPEPSVLLFMGVGLVAVGVWGRKRFSNRNL